MRIAGHVLEQGLLVDGFVQIEHAGLPFDQRRQFRS